MDVEVGGRTTRRNCAVGGSVWESRMKSDEVKGGIKVFIGGEESPEENGDKKLRPKQSPLGVSGKRKTWKSENSEVSERNPIPIARQRSEQSKSLDEQCKALSVSADGIKRSPIQSKKTRSEEAKELSGSVDRIERNPIQIRKAKSESRKFTEKNPIQLRKVKSESNKAVEGNDKNPIQLRKAKSVTNKALDDSGKNSDGLGAIELKKVKPEPSNMAVDESAKGHDGAAETTEKNPVGIEESESEETCKEFGVCEEKVISSSLSNAGQAKSAPELAAPDEDGDEEEDWDEELDEEVDEEIEVEMEKCIDVKEINMPEQQKPEKVVIEEKMLHQIPEKPVPIAPIVKKQAPPSVSHSRTPPTPTKTKPTPISHGFQRCSETHTRFQSNPQTHNKLQSLVDLVMWKDISKSAFVFGVGTFIIMSSSYAKDLNISLITVVSYLGLIYLGAIFLFRSIISRGAIEIDETRLDSVVGEEEAVWLLKMVLPYLNEFLLKLRDLFSGDPGTTMKLAVLLFVLARCGSSITVWKLAKFGFFGVFTVPKICSSYSSQFAAYGKFWVRRFQDAWESCSHKKAVAFGIFTLVWNLCSVEARIWAAFMLFVAFRYYHQSIMRENWVEQEAECETSWQEQIGGQKARRGPTMAGTKKEKKRF